MYNNINSFQTHCIIKDQKDFCKPSLTSHNACSIFIKNWHNVSRNQKEKAKEKKAEKRKKQASRSSHEPIIIRIKWPTRITWNFSHGDAGVRENFPWPLHNRGSIYRRSFRMQKGARPESIKGPSRERERRWRKARAPKVSKARGVVQAREPRAAHACTRPWNTSRLRHEFGQRVTFTAGTFGGFHSPRLCSLSKLKRLALRST